MDKVIYWADNKEIYFIITKPYLLYMHMHLCVLKPNCQTERQNIYRIDAQRKNQYFN